MKDVVENVLKNRMFFRTSISEAFWKDFGRVSGGFWLVFVGLGRILGRFREDFGRFLMVLGWFVDVFVALGCLCGALGRLLVIFYASFWRSGLFWEGFSSCGGERSELWCGSASLSHKLFLSAE